MRLQHTWAQTAQTFQQTADRLGRGIDPGIFETVVALNALGIETSGSCEGHLERAIAAPWVDIEALSADKLNEQVLKRFAHARHEHERHVLPQNDVDDLFAQAHQEQKRVKRMHLEQRKALLDFLTAFYEHRQVRYDVRLVILPRDPIGRARLESQGADFQVAAPEEERAQRLKEYQEEMQTFTAFLKETLFQAE